MLSSDEGASKNNDIFKELMYERLLGLRDFVRTVRWSSLAFLGAASPPLCRHISASNFCFALQECSGVFGQLPGTHSVKALAFIVVTLRVLYGRECRGVCVPPPEVACCSLPFTNLYSCSVPYYMLQSSQLAFDISPCSPVA